MRGMIVLACALCCAGALHAADGPEAEAVNIWSGREQVVPTPSKGRWELLAEHGRTLASGTGEVRLNIPALNDGACVDATLSVDGAGKKVKIWSTKILKGFSASFELGGGDDKRLRELGLDDSRDAKAAFARTPPAGAPKHRLTLVFPDKRDFPMPVGEKWERVSLVRSKVPDGLSAILEKKERALDSRGDYSHAVLEGGGKRVVVFAPGFDFGDIENILVIRKYLKEDEK